MSTGIHEGTRDHFESMAKEGTWPSRYTALNSVNYNFFTRRESVLDLIRGDFFPAVLDIGCGTGDYFEILSDLTNRYVGVDFSESMIEQARSRYGGHPKKPVFQIGSAEALPYPDNEFDLICAIGFIEYFADPDAPMREITRVLKPGGTLVIQSYQIDFFRKMANTFGLEKVKTLLRPLKHALLRRKRSSAMVDRPYSKQALDELVARHGLEIASYRYNNFHILPATARRLFSRAYITLSERVTKNGSHRYNPFAVNYVGRYTLKRKAG